MNVGNLADNTHSEDTAVFTRTSMLVVALVIGQTAVTFGQNLVVPKGWRHGAYGRVQKGDVTYGLIGDNNTQVDIIYSFPLVAIPKPAAVKSIQLMRELNGTKESVTEVIKGKALKAVADWVGTVPIGDLLGRNNKGDSLGKGRQVTTEPHPTKKEKLDTGGAPFEARLPIDPLRFNAGQFVDNDTSEKRAEDHRKNLAKYRYYWIVVDVDGNENEIDLKDAGPDKGKP